jgi:hypothetical protein
MPVRLGVLSGTTVFRPMIRVSPSSARANLSLPKKDEPTSFTQECPKEEATSRQQERIQRFQAPRRARGRRPTIRQALTGLSQHQVRERTAGVQACYYIHVIAESEPFDVTAINGSIASMSNGFAGTSAFRRSFRQSYGGSTLTRPLINIAAATSAGEATQI